MQPVSFHQLPSRCQINTKQLFNELTSQSWDQCFMLADDQSLIQIIDCHWLAAGKCLSKETTSLLNRERERLGVFINYIFSFETYRKVITDSRGKHKRFSSYFIFTKINHNTRIHKVCIICDLITFWNWDNRCNKILGEIKKKAKALPLLPFHPAVPVSLYQIRWY